MATILHVVVVGFHHRRGCQVEYCYPPLARPSESSKDKDNVTSDAVSRDEKVSSSEICLPPEWVQLPTLALPDGVHNVSSDSVYFHLPPRPEDGGRIVYGVSCYRQIATEDLLKKDDDVTRCSVQKSVCVISRKPVYGLIKAKLELITEAYFNERNFDNVSVLAEMYDSLCQNIAETLKNSEPLLGIFDFVISQGLSVRDLILEYRQRTLVIMKLILLERKVLFHMFPVEKLCHTVLAFCSLFPEMVESGLVNSAFDIPADQLAAARKKRRESQPDAEILLEKNSAQPQTRSHGSKIAPVDTGAASQSEVTAQDQVHTPKSPSDLISPNGEYSYGKTGSLTLKSSSQNGSNSALEPSTNVSKVGDGPPRPDNLESEGLVNAIEASTDSTTPFSAKQLINDSYTKMAEWRNKISHSISSLNSPEDPHAATVIGTAVESPEDPLDADELLATLPTDEFGFPLSIYTNGVVCHPYWSLAYMDHLDTGQIRAYTFGATNNLFRQRSSLFDVIIHEEDEKLHMDFVHQDMRRQLALTTEDLRFVDYVHRCVAEQTTGNVFTDNAGWEGGDEWVRLQFRTYLLQLAATCRKGEPEKEADFNLHFVRAWKRTRNYRIWHALDLPAINQIEPGRSDFQRTDGFQLMDDW